MIELWKEIDGAELGGNTTEKKGLPGKKQGCFEARIGDEANSQTEKRGSKFAEMVEAPGPPREISPPSKKLTSFAGTQGV